MSTLITKDMPEPKEYGAYLFTYPDLPDIYPSLIMHDPSHHGKTWINDLCWETWEVVRRQHNGYTIESLAEHDARIRREALTHLSMTDIDVAIRAYENAKYTWDDNNMPLRMAFKAVAENRERVS